MTEEVQIPDMKDPSTGPQVAAVSSSLVVVLLARQVERRLEADLQPLGLSLRKLGLLGHLAGEPGRSFTELARRARITVQSVHVIVATLIDDGLVETTSVSTRGKPATLALTEFGQQRLAAGRSRMANVDFEVFGDNSNEAHQALGLALELFARSTRLPLA